MYEVFSPGTAAVRDFAAEQPSIEERLQRRERVLYRLALARSRRRRRPVRRVA